MSKMTQAIKINKGVSCGVSECLVEFPDEFVLACDRVFGAGVLRLDVSKDELEEWRAFLEELDMNSLVAEACKNVKDAVSEDWAILFGGLGVCVGRSVSKSLLDDFNYYLEENPVCFDTEFEFLDNHRSCRPARNKNIQLQPGHKQIFNRRLMSSGAGYKGLRRLRREGRL